MPGILLFDIDNTLLQGSKSHRQAFHEALNRVYGIHGDVESINPHGKTDRQIIAEVLARNGVDKKTASKGLEECMDVMVCAFARLVKQEKLVVLDGVFEMLNLLQSHPFGLGLVTGNLESIAWEKLQRAGLKKHFLFGGFGSDHAMRSKLVGIALERARKIFPDASTTPVFLIGDTPRDIVAGRDAGVYTIAVATGVYTQNELLRHGPDFVLPNLTPSEGLEDILFRPVR
jgi:phosphoglycolate phosphatase-like HAD superfamily hydrolase